MEHQLKSEAAKDFLSFQISRQITHLYKDFLNILEDTQLNQSGPVNYKLLRKRILDKGNDTIREITVLLEKVNIDLKG